MEQPTKKAEISRNLRHLRVFLAVADVRSLTLASDICSVSQPAVTQSISKLEAEAGGELFSRSRQGVFVTDRGEVLVRRVRRAFELLDPALNDLSPRLSQIVTSTQLRALIAVREAENFSLAAKRLGVSQPTVHRAVSQLESAAGRSLFERASHGLIPSRAAKGLAQSARLAFAELEQADAEIAEFDGREAGRIVIGALPLSRTFLLPKALADFRRVRRTMPIEVIDGPYDDLLAGLRRGDIDFIIGALRVPAPIGDVVQDPLFNDTLAFVAGPQHELVGRKQLDLADLAGRSWVVPRPGSPSRGQFDDYFRTNGLTPPASLIESGSVLFLRELLGSGDFIGCVSGQLAEAEIAKGLIARLDVIGDWPGRAIGLTTRSSWIPTKSQQIMLDLLREKAAMVQSL